ncbi:MAG: oxidoreductase [Actinomycetales bacterium]|nr:oxidoreductase [Actinomycetales bacterium]
MGLFSRRRRAAPAAGRNGRRQEIDEVRRHLADFVATRRGVEAFVEPPTTVTPPTVLLVAATGEWTRRRVHDQEVLQELASRHAVPVYDVQLVGYPQRMRDWNERARREARRARAAEDG